jgi:hypothetical protein
MSGLSVLFIQAQQAVLELVESALAAQKAPRDRPSCHARPAPRWPSTSAGCCTPNAARGTRRDSRALTCFHQAVFALRWL